MYRGTSFTAVPAGERDRACAKLRAEAKRAIRQVLGYE